MDEILGLTPDQVKKYKEAFDNFNKNDHGKIFLGLLFALAKIVRKFSIFVSLLNINITFSEDRDF